MFTSAAGLGLGLALPLSPTVASATGAARSPDQAPGGNPGDQYGAGLPADGTPAPPTRDVAAIQRAQAAAPAPHAVHSHAVPPPTFTFLTSGYTAHAVPAALLPYALTTPVPLVDDGVHDAQGVRMFLIGTTQFNHPVAQAQYGLANLSSYALTQNATYLNRAIAQANRLLSLKVASRGAWFYPYPFNFALHGIAADTMVAPWYSGMAQGQALSLFVRLYQVTSDATWLTAADNTAASFALPPVAGLPSIVHVDTANRLWLDEYPLSTTRFDLTFNGHNFAIFGLYDYVMQTGDTTAAQLFDGAVTMSLAYGTSGFRAPGTISYYCELHHQPAGHYHDIHIGQLLNLYSMTTDTHLAQLSDAFRSDFPQNGTSTVLFSKGSHTGYKFNASGGITATKVLSLSATSQAPSSGYTRIPGRGLYLLISAGSLAGYYVPDTPNVTTAIGPFDTAVYSPQRVASFPAGVTTGVRFNSQGLPSTSASITLSRVSNAPFSESSTFNGTRYVLITAGGLANYWVPAAQLTLG